MTWTYSGAPGTNDADGRRDAVRLLIGDTDTNDQQVSDEEIAFALSQAADDIYRAGAILARALSGKYARMVDTAFEGVRSSYSQRRDSYNNLAAELDKQSTLYGDGGLGIPSVGGISISDMESVEDDDDRVRPAFRRGQFDNPPFSSNREEDTPETR